MIMKSLRCPSCAGTLLLVDPENDKYICEYCGMPTSLKSYDNEKMETIKNRANDLFLSCDFDGAAALYQTVVAESVDDAEVYWFLSLCKYGIQYVDDPVTRRKIPTCHRTLFSSILNDSDYLNAIKYAGILEKKAYQEAAQRIDEIQSGILRIVEKENPYDIFICYKETDVFGHKTKESDIAKDLYYKLTAEGYRTFYAPITLQSYAGREFEPYIFSALNSAKLMFVIGFSREHYEAVWVKNEWSRFLARKSKHPELLLVSCYNSYINDASVLPNELNKTQAKDLYNSSTNDLVADVKKWLPKGISDASFNMAASSVGTNALSLCKRGMLCLEDRDFKSAMSFFDKSLNDNAEFSQAYWGILLAENMCSSAEELCDKCIKIWDSKNFKKAVRFATPAENAMYEDVCEKIKTRIFSQQNELRKNLKAEILAIRAKELVSESSQIVKDLEVQYYELLDEVIKTENEIRTVVCKCEELLEPYNKHLNELIVSIRKKYMGIKDEKVLSDEAVAELRVFINSMKTEIENGINADVKGLSSNNENIARLMELLRKEDALGKRIDDVMAQISGQKTKLDGKYKTILEINKKYTDAIQNVAKGANGTSDFATHTGGAHSVSAVHAEAKPSHFVNIQQNVDSLGEFVDVRLKDPGINKMTVMKMIKVHLDISLMEAKSFVDSAPCIIKKNFEMDRARTLVQVLISAGAIATIEKSN